MKKQIFFASINVSFVFELDGNYKKDNLPIRMAEFLINEVSEFCECVSLRIDDGAPCFLVIKNVNKKKSYLRINPEPNISNITSTISTSIRKANIKKLLKLKLENIVDMDVDRVLVAMIVDGCEHWDRNFLKVSEAYPNRLFNLIGWHEYSSDYANQAIEDGDFDTGIETNGGNNYLGVAMLSRFGLTEEDFDIALYK